LSNNYLDYIIMIKSTNHACFCFHVLYAHGNYGYKLQENKESFDIWSCSCICTKVLGTNKDGNGKIVGGIMEHNHRRWKQEAGYSLFLQRNQFVEVDSNFLKKIGFESYG
jgi:hypothetical protein